MRNTQCAKKVMSDSPGLVDFAVELVIFVLNLPNGQVLFLGANSNCVVPENIHTPPTDGSSD